MLDAILGKFVLFVLGLVEPDDEADVHLLEDGHVVFGGERAISVSHVQWAGEGDEFSRQDPIEVAVLDLFEVLVLLDVKGSVVVPAEGDGKLQALEAVQVDAFVRACSHRGVSIGQELVLVGFESCPGIVSCLLQDNDHECAHEEGRVGLLGVVERCVVVNLVGLILRVIHELLQLLTEQMHFAQIERSEVGEERFVHEIIVDAEVERVLTRLRRGLITDPVKTLANNLDGLIIGGVLALFSLYHIRLV